MQRGPIHDRGPIDKGKHVNSPLLGIEAPSSPPATALYNHAPDSTTPRPRRRRRQVGFPPSASDFSLLLLFSISTVVSFIGAFVLRWTMMICSYIPSNSEQSNAVLIAQSFRESDAIFCLQSSSHLVSIFLQFSFVCFLNKFISEAMN